MSVADRDVIVRIRARTVALAAVVVGAILLLWMLRGVATLAFAAIVLAIGLSALAAQIRRVAPIGRTAAVALAILTPILGLAGAIGFGGAFLAREAAEVADRLPGAIDSVARTIGLDASALRAEAIEQLQQYIGTLMSGAATAGAATATAVGGLVIVIVAGGFLALDPEPYRQGALALVDEPRRSRLSAAFDDCAAGIRQWLLAQLASMAIVAALTYVGLLIAGVPAAAVLALINGVAEFVPIVGAWVGAAPALLVAAGQDASTFWKAAVVLFAVQQLESNLILPLLMRGMVKLQPAALLLAVLAFGSLFGIGGVVLAAPLMVVIAAMLRHLRAP